PFIMKERKMFEQWLKARYGKKLDELNETERAQYQAEFDREVEGFINRTDGGVTPVAPAAPVEPKREGAVIDRDAFRSELEKEILGKEFKRREAIRKEADGLDIPEDVLQRSLDNPEVTVESARGVFLDHIRQHGASIGAPGIIVKGGDIQRSTIEDGIMLRAGMEDVILNEEKGAERANRADEIRDISLREVCEEALRLDGVSVPRKSEEMISRAFTTNSLPQILGNVANKSMLRGYNLAAATWQAWCSTGSEKDFKTNTKVRLSDLGDLEEVTNKGEVADGSSKEEYEQYSLARYAKKQTISDVDIINDDLSLLTRTPQLMGSKASALISKLVYTHLLANGNMSDGNALFHTAKHKNLVTTASYKLSVGAEALRKAIETFRKQTDASGEPIDVAPAVLLCCPEDEEYARALLRSITLTEGTTARQATANIYGNMGIMPVVETRLSNSTYTGYSTTAWYLIGDKNAIDTVQVSFLNGKQTPTLQFFNQQQMGINTIGIGYRVIMDASAKALDWRGMVKVAGA
ncbi:MAG: hypothetical protein JXR97_16905, partial [Planctomycetes bacterium]|nr:hypothetical protein [Planctomycetota bacterium]